MYQSSLRPSLRVLQADTGFLAVGSWRQRAAGSHQVLSSLERGGLGRKGAPQAFENLAESGGF